MPRELVLGSASPRRAEILRALGYVFRQRTPMVDETQLAGESVQEYLHRVVAAKFADIASTAQDAVVVCADTVVLTRDGVLLQKPGSPEENALMLRALSGRKHEVRTALHIGNSRTSSYAVCFTQVVFRTLLEAEIEHYVATDDGRDKAGGYSIQGRAGAFVERIEGSYSNVVGLPAHLVALNLREHGVLPT